MTPGWISYNGDIFYSAGSTVYSIVTAYNSTPSNVYFNFVSTPLQPRLFKDGNTHPVWQYNRAVLSLTSTAPSIAVSSLVRFKNVISAKMNSIFNSPNKNYNLAINSNTQGDDTVTIQATGCTAIFNLHYGGDSNGGFGWNSYLSFNAFKQGSNILVNSDGNNGATMILSNNLGVFRVGVLPNTLGNVSTYSYTNFLNNVHLQIGSDGYQFNNGNDSFIKSGAGQTYNSGGNINVYGGQNSKIFLQGGGYSSSSIGGKGGDISILAGDAGGYASTTNIVNGSGGNIYIQTGAKKTIIGATNTVVDGSILITTGNRTAPAVVDGDLGISVQNINLNGSLKLNNSTNIKQFIYGTVQITYSLSQVTTTSTDFTIINIFCYNNIVKFDIVFNSSFNNIPITIANRNDTTNSDFDCSISVVKKNSSSVTLSVFRNDIWNPNIMLVSFICIGT